jgi:hypothetical protein
MGQGVSLSTQFPYMQLQANNCYLSKPLNHKHCTGFKMYRKTDSHSSSTVLVWAGLQILRILFEEGMVCKPSTWMTGMSFKKQTALRTGSFCLTCHQVGQLLQLHGMSGETKVSQHKRDWAQVISIREGLNLSLLTTSSKVYCSSNMLHS